MSGAARTAAALLLALLVACPAARAWQARIEATDADAAPLLALAAHLAGRDDLSRTIVERATGAQLTEQDRNGAFAFFRASAVSLGAMTLADIDYREPRPGGGGTAGALLALDVAGPCIRRERIEARFGPLALTDAPHGHSLDEKAVWSLVRSDRTLGFGFRERDPDCLGTIAVQVRAPPAEKTNR